MNKKRVRSPILILVALAGLSIAGGCKAKAVRGGPETDNPRLDEAALSTGLDRKDLEYMARSNLEKLFASPLWAQWKMGGQQPVLAIWPVKNDTSEHLDDQMLTLLSTLETDLINSGIVGVVSRERQSEMVAEVNVQNTAAFDPAMAAQLGKQIGANYFVTGKLQAVDERMNKERRVQYTLFMQIIDVETSLVKFQTQTERTKAIVR